MPPSIFGLAAAVAGVEASAPAREQRHQRVEQVRLPKWFARYALNRPSLSPAAAAE
jgi:hypothetical protein